MCGIIGVIDPGQRYAVRFDLLRDSMMSRGPDGWGEFVEGGVRMAMRRLAIIDLARGDQPFYSRGGEVVAFQNGEIYNYRSLKAELEAAGAAFVSGSDTEVLAHGYTEWGIDGLLKRLDGMYAVAIYDRRDAVLHLARDRFGEKPLFITSSPDCFAYASSLISVAALPWVDLAIDEDALDRYLALHYVPGEATLLKGIRRLLPGERLELQLREMTLQRHRYFVPKLGMSRLVDLEEAAAEVEEAVASRLVADVPVGVFLSGGVDSSLVAAIAAKHSPGIRTFSISFTEDAYDESVHARRVAEHIGSTHSTFRFDLGSFRALLPEVANALDEPVGDQAMLPVYWLSRDAGASVKVVLSGEGADELFAGYDYYRRFSTAKSNGVAAPLNSFVNNMEPITPSGFPLIGDAPLRRRLTGHEAPAVLPWEQDQLAYLTEAATPLERARVADLHSWLASDLLVKLDRMTMAHSLEGRAPYLKPELAQMALSAPEALLLSPERDKILLRAVAERWLPWEIAYRRKQGFVLPMRGWLRDWIGSNGGPRTYFAGVEALGLEPAQTAALVEEDLRCGGKRERLLFALVLLKEWHRCASSKISSLRRWIQRDSGASPVEILSNRRT
jgi:asparagine synthase (glutamine-hydrolysing)